MLRVQVCAALMDGVLGPKFPKQKSFFGIFLSVWIGLAEKAVKNGYFSAKICHKRGDGRPPSIYKSCIPWQYLSY